LHGQSLVLPQLPSVVTKLMAVEVVPTNTLIST